MTLFDDINRRAELSKAKKRATYEPLPAAVYRDDPIQTMTVYTTPATTYGGATRSTHNGQLLNTHVIIARPTEVLALRAAAGLWHYDDEPPLVDTPALRRRDKYCACCETHKPFASFGTDKRTSDGYTLLCRACREKLRTAYWTRGKHLSIKVAQIRLTEKKAVVR